MNNAGIYIHFPFCNRKCNYCDYYSIEKETYDLGLFIKSLLIEIELAKQLTNKSWIFDTIYFGGGSPGLIEVNDFKLIIDKLYKNFNLSSKPEITIEINPGENSLNHLIKLKKLGVNRLSLGLQSLNPYSLKLLSRDHFTNDYFKTYNDAIDAGYKNINVDLLYNIPGQTIKSWITDLKSVVKIRPSHITIISLILEPETQLYSNLKDTFSSFIDSEVEEKMFKQAAQELQRSNYIQYETGHFSKPNMQSNHNLHYWNLDPYIGLGPSAHSYNGLKRWWNINSLSAYTSYLKKGKSPISNYEILSEIDKYNEKIINGLRTEKGIATKDIQNMLKTQSFQQSLNKWKKYLNISPNIISLKKENFHLTDKIVTDFIIDSSIPYNN